jgi:hypothetical protein
MARIAIAVLALAGALASCSLPGVSPRAISSFPSASIDTRLEALSGHWRGTIAETAGWYLQGSAPVDLTIAPDGKWAGTIGKAKATGVVALRGRDVVLTGSARTPTGHEDAVYLRLAGDDTLRWGETLGLFEGRQERASVSLTKTS